MDLFKYGFTARSERADSGPSEDGASQSGPSTSVSSSKDDIPSPENDPKNDSEAKNPAKRVRESARESMSGRKYDPNYLAYGFTFVESKGKQCPLCVVCKQILANSSMAPTKLLRHLTTAHPLLKDKPKEYFQHLNDELKGQKKCMDEFGQTELAAIESSFAVAYEIAKAKKPFTIAEQLLQPCISKVVEIMLGSAASAKINLVPLSDTTIMRRFEDMANDVENQLCARLQRSHNFTLQFDESTDIANEAILIGFVRYTHELHIVEDIFCFSSLSDQTTGEKIFESINKKMQDYALDWKNVVGLCTDGASSMTGKYKGLATKVSAVANEEFVASHCVLHREALASKNMSSELNDTLKDAVKIINNIKSNPLHSRIFSLICKEMESEHQNLLFHADIRWLSRGRTLSRLHELCEELSTYFKRFIAEKKSKEAKKRKTKNAKGKPEKPEKLIEEILLEKINDQNWLSTLAYLADIFESLNDLNLQMQGRQMNCFVFWNKVEAFKRKLLIWREEVATMDLSAFSRTSTMVTNNESVADFIQPIVSNHLQKLIDEFEKYFPANSDPRSFHSWIVHPFLNLNDENSLSRIEQNQLIGKFFHRSLSMIG